MTKGGSWTALEKFVLVRSSKEELPLLADLMERPLEAVVSKYKHLQLLYEEQIKDRAQSFMEKGMEEDEAFLKAIGDGTILEKK